MLKRCFDLLLVIVTAPFWLPLLGLVALSVWFTMGRPVWFRQQRPGFKGQPFILLKFRTMRQGSGNDEERLTAWGRWLRRSSLDELPELLNVLRGEMSLVGPRPLLMEYLTRYSPEQARRHEVLPGLTGWAQVHGRNSVDWNERFALDRWYVDHHTFWIDIKILYKTIGLVIRGQGITPAQSKIMPVFPGNNDPMTGKHDPDANSQRGHCNR